MTKKEWLKERIFVDTYGRPYNASDVPMTYMTREEAFIKRGYSEDEIYKFMSEKYGEWIVFKPSLNLANSTLWIAPYIVLILGVFILLKFTRKKKNN